jgi:4-hydroxy-3-methylbut-2-enyl diphosphate reductase
VADITEKMLKDAKSIGISGATSTPRWIMEEIKNRIEQQQ